MLRGSTRERVAIFVLCALALTVTACDNGSHAKATPGSSTSASTAVAGDPASSTGSSSSASTPAAPGGPSSDPPAGVDAGGGGGGPVGLTLADTGLTHVRVTVDNAAAWVTVFLQGATIDVSKIVSTVDAAQVTGLGGNQIAVWNTGQAVVDLVLRVPHGVQPALVMCKNYQGPASVTITRLTDAPTTIASVTNTGSNTAVSPGSCENWQSTPLARSDLIGPVRWPARRDARPLVLAAYYPWYDANALNHDFGDDPVGPANTFDPATVASAIDLAASHGVDGFVVEYETTPANDPAIDTAYNTADARGGFQMAMLLDLALLAERNNGITSGMLDTVLGGAMARTFHPSQLRVGNQPVMFVYGADKVDPYQWAAALDRLRAATGVTPFIVSDAAATGSPGRYLYSTNTVPTLDQLLQWANYTLLDLQERPALDAAASPLWVAPVSPGYDDTRLGRQSPVYVDRAGGQRYDNTWDAALSSLPDWIFITSWNEYYEQTHIMPGTWTGDRALQQTASWASQFHTTG